MRVYLMALEFRHRVTENAPLVNCKLSSILPRRFIIGFKNLLRAVEFTGKSGIYGIRYLSQGHIERRYFYDFVRYEMLRKDYLNQVGGI
jgi:hypothetical protein